MEAWHELNRGGAGRRLRVWALGRALMIFWLERIIIFMAHGRIRTCNKLRSEYGGTGMLATGDWGLGNDP
jgi:hypothetical protein